jgi:hypothetical protein
MSTQQARSFGKSSILTALTVLGCCCSCALPSIAQSNSFFGSNGASQINPNQLGNTGREDDGAAGPGIPAVNGAMPVPAPAGGDYSQDEKRMQHKYRGNLRHAQDLIRQGDEMMKAAGNNKDDKNYKKGKILKEVGEKSLASLKAGNPFDIDKDKPIFAERKSKTAAEKQVNP